MINLEKKNIIVTGASGGIGSAIIKKLDEAGANILASGTRVKKLEELKTNFEGIKILKFDISQSDKIEEFIENATNELGGSLDGIVNNAGITRDNLLLRMKTQEWDDVLTTNLSGVFRISKAVLRGMMKAKTGRIINIASVIGVTGNPGQANYAAAKAGIIGFTKSLAQEVGSRNITVNSIAPGFIDTDMTQILSEQQRNSILENVPLGRLGDVRDIANAVNFLASPAASYITGETLHVNGGMVMD